jgi:hypothetical protein
MAKSEKYQGWANYETWNVALWFGNDYGMYQAVKGQPTKFTAASAEEFTKELLPNGTPDFESRGGAKCYAKVNWKEIAADFNEMRGDSGVKEAPSRGSLRTMEGMPLREMGNIYWRDIPTGTRVELVGHSYIVTLGNGEKKGAYWEGREAREAQRTLDRWVARGYSFGVLPGRAAEQTMHAADRWEVIVGNIGTVFDGSRESAARATYKDYVIQSKSGNGRAGGEDVTLMQNGEPVDEHFGTNGNVDVDETRRRPAMHAAPMRPLREHPYPPPRRPGPRPLPRRRS